MANTEAAIGRDLRCSFDGGSLARLTEAQLPDRVARRPAPAAAVARRLALAAATKSAAAVLAVVSLIAAGAGPVAMAGRDVPPRPRPDSPQAEGAARAGSPAVDRFGDPLPAGAITRLGTSRFRHEPQEGAFRSVSFTPDGKMLITVGLGEEARAWDLATGHLIRSIEASEAVLARDGRTLFVARPGLLRAVDLSTGRELRRIEFNPEEQPRKLVISQEGKNLAAIVVQVRQDGKVLREPRSALISFDAATLAERRRFAGDYQHIRDIAVSLDGQVLAVAGPDGEEPFVMAEPRAAAIRLLDVAGGAEIRRIAVEGFGVGSLAFSPDGKALAAGIGDRTVRLYDVASGRERLPRLGREAAVPPPKKGEGAHKGFDLARAAACLAFSPDGSLLASGPEGIGYFGDLVNVPPITLWDVATARSVRKFAGHPYGISALAFSPDDKTLASVGGEPTARLWDVATGREMDHRDGHPNGIHALAVSAADGTVFTIGQADGLVIQWNPADGRSLGRLGVTPRMFDGMAISNDGRTLLVGDPYGPIVWDVIGRNERCRITDKDLHERFVQPAVAPDGTTIASNLSVWDAASGRRLVTLAKHGWLESPYTADGRRVISVEKDGVHVWEIATGQEVGRPIRSELFGWFNAAVSPDGRLVAVGNVDRSQRRLPGEAEPRSDPAIRIWELASGKPVARLLGHTTSSCDLAFSPDGRMLASVSGGRRNPRTGDRGLRVWEIATGRQVRRFSNYPAGGSLVAYLPDGRSIITASEDGTALVWDVSDLADRRPPELPTAKALEALWSDLASSNDAPRGYRASWSLSIEAAVPFLRDRLRPAATGEPSAGPEVLRTLRAIAALERIDTPPAREVLERIAQGAAGAPATRDAAEALLRLARKRTPLPGAATRR